MHAERIEVRNRAVTTGAPPDDDRLAGLQIGLGHAGWTADHPADASAEGSATAAAIPRHSSDDPLHRRCRDPAGLRRLRVGWQLNGQQRHHLLAEAHYR